jgi:hypothetical protein
MTAITAPIVRFTSLFFAQTTQSESAPAASPLALHPENPHYFLFRGKPTVLITSGEHLGAVINTTMSSVAVAQDSILVFAARLFTFPT